MSHGSPSPLSLSLFGGFQAALDGVPLTAFESNKVRGLLAYLAVEQRSHSREVLSGLLWPEQPEKTARASLRNALFNLRKVLGDKTADPPYLLTSRNAIQFNPAHISAVDTERFSALLVAAAGHVHRRGPCRVCAGHLEQAVSLYTGSFLHGLHVRESAALEDWMALTREAFQQQVLEALDTLSSHYEMHGQLTQAQKYTRRLLEIAPWEESAHRRMMRLLASADQRTAALEQYERCRQILSEELGVEPGEETRRLYEQLRGGDWPPDGTPSPAPPHPGPPPRHHLPHPTTPFVGRRQELTWLADSLNDPACRLLTLTGPGGIGKTRLALKAAADTLLQYPDGVHFIPLASVLAPQNLLRAIAEVLEFTLNDRGDPLKQLTGYLHRRETLLVLDNFEHLLEAAGQVSEILQRAPGLQILVTSRERLGLQGEWVLPLHGLDLPETPTSSNLEASAAIRLFRQTAQRIRLDFDPTSQEWEDIHRICQQLQGFPLAIELAASWVPVMPCDEIAAHLQQGLDFLSTRRRDLAPRHRDLRVVFDHSWRLLIPEEQNTFRQLAVFRGSFSQQALVEITEASPALLSALIDKSLLVRHANGRYEVHALLREYAAEKLAQQPDLSAVLRQRHAAFFLDFLAQQEARLVGGSQAESIQAISADLENIWLAWAWAVRHHAWDMIARALEAIFVYLQARSLLRDGLDTFNHLLDALKNAGQTGNLLYGRALARQGRLLLLIGQHQQAQSILRQAIEALQPFQAEKEMALCLRNLGNAAFYLGDTREARRLCERSLMLSKKTGDLPGAATALNSLAVIAHMLDHYEEARRYNLESLAIKKHLDDQKGIAISLGNLGTVAQAEKNFPEARRFYEQSVAISRQIGDLAGVALTLNNLGDVHRLTGELEAAQRAYQESIAVARQIGDNRTVIYCLDDLGKIARLRGDLRAAVRYQHQALEAASEYPLLSLDIITELGCLAQEENDLPRAAYLLSCVIQIEEGSAPDVQEKAAGLLDELRTRLSPEELQKAAARARGRSLAEVREGVLSGQYLLQYEPVSRP